LKPKDKNSANAPNPLVTLKGRLLSTDSTLALIVSPRVGWITTLFTTGALFATAFLLAFRAMIEYLLTKIKIGAS
jgi:hypothetical protein